LPDHKRWVGFELLRGLVIAYNELKTDFVGRVELDFGGIVCEYGGLSPLASTSVERSVTAFFDDQV